MWVGALTTKPAGHLSVCSRHHAPCAGQPVRIPDAPLPLGRLAQAETAAPTESTSFLAPVAELPEPVGRRLQQVGWHLVGYLRILLLVCAHFAAEPAAVGGNWTARRWTALLVTA